jgi:SAM-dependent methyltransferase
VPRRSSSRRGPVRSDVSRVEADGRQRPLALYSRLVADLPIDLEPGLAERLIRVLDVEGKLLRALDALGPVRDRDVVLVDGAGGIRARQLIDLGARVTPVEASGPAPFDAPDGSADVVVSFWSAFRGAPPDEVAHARRLLRPGGRLIVVHDYGRDDVSALRGELPEHGPWSRRDGPFLGHGFKVRVLHCWWTFASLEDARAFLADAFGQAGQDLGRRLTRPRVSYNLAIYHRTFAEAHA